MNKKIILIFLIVTFLFLVLMFLYPKEKYNIKNSVYKINCYTENEIKSGYGLLYKITDSGYIITNYHIIKDGYKIILEKSSKKIEASVVNYDEYSDIAVLSIDKKYAADTIKLADKYKTLYTLDSYNSKEVKELKYIENTRVIIDLEKEKFIVDAMKLKGIITYGNSGGPLFNEDNEILGIVFTKDENYGYALDINKSLKIAEQLEKGKIDYPKLPLDIENENGIVIKKDNDSFKNGDLIISINNNKVRNIMELNYYIHKYNVGDNVEIMIKRGKETYIKQIILT